jgi:anti-sigma factor RsiW
MKRSAQHAFEPEEIMAYLDGELAPREAAVLATHVEHCSDCQSLAAQLRQVSERLLDFEAGPCPPRMDDVVLGAMDSKGDRVTSSLGAEKRPKQRRFVRGFAWAFASILILAIAVKLSIPNLMRSKMSAKQAQEVAKARELSVDGQSRRRSSGLATLVAPGIAPDSNGLYHGLGDHAEGSFNVDGRPLTDQQSKVFSNQIGPMIVQTASVTILASNYDQASGGIEHIATQHGGYVQDMTADTPTGSARSVSATLRVPDSQLQSFLADLRKLGHVEQEARNNQEITDQYIDLQARLKTARATEQRIIELLGTRTGKLADVLQAEQELARIRGEIESMEGQRAHVEHQVRYATVQVQMNEEYREQLNSKSFSTGTRIRNSLVEGFGNLAGGVVAALMFAFAYGPSILFWLAILGGPAWFVWRRYRAGRQA